jgi:hypothetical protein
MKVVVAIAVAILPLAAAAVAQAPVPNDSVIVGLPADDSARFNRRPPMVEGMLLMPIAPGALALLLRKEPGPELPPLGFWERRLAVHAAVGGGVARSDSNTCAYSAGVEILLRGIYAEARTEHFLFPKHIEYRTARLGYLFHPLPEAAGGITLGYRDAQGIPAHDGLEVAFPFVTGSRTWWLRYEAAYVFSRDTPSWSYRMQAEFLIRGGPLYAGLNVEAKSLPLRTGSKVFSIPLSVIVGVRH